MNKVISWDYIRKGITLLLALFMFPISEVLAADTVFPDVQEGHTFYQYITNLHQREVVHGYSDGYFRPDDFVKRGEFAKIVKRGLNIPTNVSCAQFPDITNTDYVFYDDVMSLKCADVIHGYSDGVFRPEENLSRGQAMKFVMRGAAYKLGRSIKINESDPDFPDVPKDHTFYDDIMRGYSNNVIDGYRDGLFRPDDSITRGQVAKIVDNTYNYLILGNNISSSGGRSRRSSGGTIAADTSDPGDTIGGDTGGDDGGDDGGDTGGDDGGDDGGDTGGDDGGDTPFEPQANTTVLEHLDLNFFTAPTGGVNLETVGVDNNPQIVYVKTNGGLLIASFEANFTGGVDLDWGSLSGDSNLAHGKSYFHGFASLRGSEGIAADATYTLYIPKRSGQTGVGVCPGADDYADINSQCTGLVEYTEADSNVSLIVNGVNTYWAVSGLSSTGGLGLLLPSDDFAISPYDVILNTSQEVEFSYTLPTQLGDTGSITITWEEDGTGAPDLTECTSPDYDLVGDASDDVSASVSAPADNTITYEVEPGVTLPAGTNISLCVNVGAYQEQASYSVLMTDTTGNYGIAMYYVNNDNDVNVSATIEPTLSFNIRNWGDTADTNVCDLGVVSTQTQPDGETDGFTSGECGYGLAIGTNAEDGFEVKVTSDQKMTDGTYILQDVETAGGFTAGTEAYGYYGFIGAQDRDDHNGTGDVIPGTEGIHTFLDLDDDPFVPRDVPFGSNPIFAEYDDPIVYVQGGVSTDLTKVIHAMTVSASTPAGTYTQMVTYTVTATF